MSNKKRWSGVLKFNDHVPLQRDGCVLSNQPPLHLFFDFFEASAFFSWIFSTVFFEKEPEVIPEHMPERDDGFFVFPKMSEESPSLLAEVLEYPLSFGSCRRMLKVKEGEESKVSVMICTKPLPQLTQ